MGLAVIAEAADIVAVGEKTDLREAQETLAPKMVQIEDDRYMNVVEH